VILPPYAQLLGLSVEPGETAPVFVMPFAHDVVGRPGFLHGGALAGLLEMAAVGALKQALDGEARIKPINVTVDYMRAGQPRDTFAYAIIERLGARIANVDAFAWQDEPDRPIAAARLNFLILR
jgi:uncharacterized protein (TIGR00369 family)